MRFVWVEMQEWALRTDGGWAPGAGHACEPQLIILLSVCVA